MMHDFRIMDVARQKYPYTSVSRLRDHDYSLVFDIAILMLLAGWYAEVLFCWCGAGGVAVSRAEMSALFCTRVFPDAVLDFV